MSTVTYSAIPEAVQTPVLPPACNLTPIWWLLIITIILLVIIIGAIIWIYIPIRDAGTQVNGLVPTVNDSNNSLNQIAKDLNQITPVVTKVGSDIEKLDPIITKIGTDIETLVPKVDTLITDIDQNFSAILNDINIITCAICVSGAIKPAPTGCASIPESVCPGISLALASGLTLTDGTLTGTLGTIPGTTGTITNLTQAIAGQSGLTTTSGLNSQVNQSCFFREEKRTCCSKSRRSSKRH